uniref:Cellulosome-anchoring protein n=1 Tax=Lygus hesperus TaxID=30085 RepID=A0A0A9XPC1_LYGHE
MVNNDRLLPTLVMEIYLDIDDELTPPKFSYLIRSVGNDSHRIFERLVQMEVDLLHVGRHVLVLLSPLVDRPLVCVLVVLLLAALDSCTTIHERFLHYHTCASYSGNFTPLNPSAGVSPTTYPTTGSSVQCTSLPHPFSMLFFYFFPRTITLPSAQPSFPLVPCASALLHVLRYRKSHI